MSWAEDMGFDGLEDIIQDHYNMQMWNLENHIWTTKDGSTIRIEDMSDRHLLNSYNRINKFNWRLEWKFILFNEITKRKLWKEKDQKDQE